MTSEPLTFPYVVKMLVVGIVVGFVFVGTLTGLAVLILLGIGSAIVGHSTFPNWTGWALAVAYVVSVIVGTALYIQGQLAEREDRP